jgi:G3E family GTPase
MRIILFTGFLGSGKTTVLMSLAEFIARGDEPGKVVIIENEIGDVDVDGKLFSNASFETRNLTSGCICCTLSGEFVSALRDLEENIKPEWIFIEATGLAHQTIVDTIRNNFVNAPLTNVVIVDCERWDELYENIPFLLTAQLERADLILINKIDCVDDTQLKHILSDVAEINSETATVKISAASDKLDDMWEKVIINEGK